MLEIEGLTKHFETFTLDNISLKLDPGYIMGLIGPNGSGKSTTIRLIMNLLKKDSGQIKIFGKDHIKFEREIKDRIGFVYDQSYFFENLSMDAMKDIIARFYKNWDNNLFNKFSKDFDLDLNQKIKKLSKGNKMKFAIALALSHRADLIIMDEPTAGLDPIFRREILEILQDIIQDENKSILYSTHITTDLDKIADYITFINHGQIVFSKSKDEMLDRYGIIKGGNDLLNPSIKSKFIGIRVSNVGFEGLVKDPKKFRNIFGSEIIIEKPSVEDIMIYSVRGCEDDKFNEKGS